MRVAIVLVGSLPFILFYFLFTGDSSGSSSDRLRPPIKDVIPSPPCQFRKYPPHRYYKLLESSQPDFLLSSSDSAAEYIYGEWPVLLSTSEKSATKLCVDQSSWQAPSATRELPFADGTNPSMLSIAHIQQHMRENNNGDAWWTAYPTAAYVATACMTNSQCAWSDSADQINQYRISRLQQPVTVRTVLLLLDADWKVIAQTTIYLYKDANWGRKVKAADSAMAAAIPPAPPVEISAADAQQQYHLPALDDARLFLYDGQLWVSYREGPGFGYEVQVINPIHINHSQPNRQPFIAILRASETEQFCCGRNMALIENSASATDKRRPPLRSLTWVDPVTVIDVAIKKDRSKGRQLAAIDRIVGGGKKKHKSHIHGTNAFMLWLPSRQEYLGIGHFHRPQDRKPNPYARFGHHYTHTFFTVKQESKSDDVSTFHLVAMSGEFIFPATDTGVRDRDGEIIQFASGLELSPDGETVIIAYGINDCEAGVVTVSLQSLNKMLRSVPPGSEVVDLMKALDLATEDKFKKGTQQLLPALPV
jgi:hypothetical protein